MNTKLPLMTAALLLLLSVKGGNVHAEDKLYKFQFAPEAAPAFSDFIKVTGKTKYSAALGYGFRNTDKLDGVNMPEPRGDDLAASYVAAKPGEEMEFLLDIPDGDYEVCFWMGRLGNLVYPRRTFWVYAGGQLKYREIIDAKTFYSKCQPQMYGVDYSSRDRGLWEKYISPRFPLRKFPVTVKGGQLNLVWKADNTVLAPNYSTFSYCAVNGLLVYPVTLAGKAEREIKRMDRTRRRSYDAYWSEIKVGKAPHEPYLPTEGDKLKGYVLFTRHYLDLIYPYTVPAKDELVKELRAFASQGEYEPASFSVYPLVDLKEVRVSLTDLKNKQGDTIANTNIKTELVIYNPDRKRRTSEYYVMPEYAMEKDLVDIPAGTTKQYLLTISVPREAEGGLYRGKIVFSPKNAPAQEIPLELRVLPFKLLPLDDHSLCFQWFTFLWEIRQQYPLPEEEYQKQVEKQVLDQKEMGCTCGMWWTSGDFTGIEVKDGKASGTWGNTAWKHAYEDTDKFFSLCSKVFPGKSVMVTLHTLLLASSLKPVGPYKYPSEEWKITVRYILDSFSELSKKYGLKPPIFYIAGECSNDGLQAIKQQAEIVKLLGEVPGATLLMSNGPEETRILAPYFDIVGMNWGGPLDEKTIAYAKAKARTGIFFNYQAHSRFDFGFYYWRIGAKGNVTEFYDLFDGDHFNNFDSFGDFIVAHDAVKFGPNGDPVHLLNYYFWREGIDDAKYLNTLTHLIKKANGSGNPDLVKKAAAAQKTIDAIMESINWDYRWYILAGNWWPGAQYDLNRWKIACEIANLKELLEWGR